MNDDELKFGPAPNTEDFPELSSHEEAPAMAQSGLSSVDPMATLSMARQRMEQLTQLKERMRIQAQARQAAMERAAQAYGSAPIDPGSPDPGLLALSQGILSGKPGRGMEGWANGMQGMQQARQKLAERDWARKAAAEKLRAESASQGMTDILNEGKIDQAMLGGKSSGHDWQMAQTSEGPVWSRIGEDGIPKTAPIGKSARDADRLIRVQSEVTKRADQLDSNFLSKAGGDQIKASQFKSEWIDAQLKAHPVASKLLPPTQEVGVATSTVVRDRPKEEGDIARATTTASVETKNRMERAPNKVIDDIQKARDSANIMDGLTKAFKPEYGGMGALGLGADTQLEGYARLGMKPDTVEFWRNYKKQSELIERHALFGASLTPGETASWKSADIHPGLHPDIIKKNLETRAVLTKKVLDYAAKDAKTMYPGSGKQTDEVAGRGQEKAPASEIKKISGEADYKALPSGAEYITPDGKHRRKR